MGEINGPKISVNQVNISSTQKQIPDAPQGITEEEPKLKDFSDPKTAYKCMYVTDHATILPYNEDVNAED